MFAENRLVDSSMVKNLVVRGFNSEVKLPLPVTYTRNIMPANRSHIPTQAMARKWPYLETIADDLMPLSNCEVGLLIGYNCAKALVPIDIIPPVGNGPYGQRTDLGWGIVGIVYPECTDDFGTGDFGTSHMVIPSVHSNEYKQGYVNHVVVCRTTVKEVIIPTDVTNMMELDFSENRTDSVSLSREDQVFLTTMREQITTTEDGHYEMPLPFRQQEPHLPNNKSMALHRLRQLKRRLLADKQYCDHYFAFMHDVIQKGYAEIVPEADLACSDGHVWYIPHHGVYHPQKPKIRVVFDCSAKFKGMSLNDHLLQGPDLTNALVGVLCRFRKEPIAFMCDIEQMFYQFKVSAEHKDYLRFWWFRNNDLEQDPVEFRMKVHLFGAVSSPGCANFGLKQVANDNEVHFSTEVANLIRRDFYVDDGLKSVSTVEEAIDMVSASLDMCSRGGLRLHKFLSNSKAVIETIPNEDRAKAIKDIDLLHDTLPVERALGIQWCIQSDSFEFRIILSDRPVTRRGILSTLSSVYDPLGFIAPFVLVGKQILQQMCRDQTDWDAPLPDALRSRWECWRLDVIHLASLKIRRCVKPDDFGEVKVVELHHFSDASTIGYGQCSYLRLVNSQQQVHCCLVFGKSRVVPLKPMTVPRLELTAALVSVKVSALLKREFDYPNVTEWFWTDSKVVLGYIANESRRFHVFVANRVQQIRDQTQPCQWRYVNTDDNPADVASRGAKADDLVNQSVWFHGPSLLWQTEPVTEQEVAVTPISFDDPEVRRVQAFCIYTDTSCTPSLIERLDYFSDWYRAKKAVAVCLRLKARLLERSVKKPHTTQSIQDLRTKSIPQYCPVTVAELQQAELEIFKLVQGCAFREEVELLHSIAKIKVGRSRKYNNPMLKKTLALYRLLEPFLDVNGILRVGGRVRKSDFSFGVRHPVILPRKGHVTELIIKHFHQHIAHQGRGMTIIELRGNGFWIMGCSSAISYHISKCVNCRRLRSEVQGQKMSDLPVDRLETNPPFTCSGVDYFGPWHIKEGRRELKRYGVLFTCISSRAIHLETANSLDTDSFINAFRRFVAIRGPVRQLRSDRGTHFVGAQRELKEAVAEMDDSRIALFLRGEGCDWVDFKMNVPSASHMGGVWERQIRSVRSVLSSLMAHAGSQLDDESLRTFMCEAAAIVNSRPLSVTNLNDAMSMEPITPNHLLTMKSRVILPPPGELQRVDLYSRKRWRRVQHLANEFWTRWQKEFLQTLQHRNKWVHSKRNMCVGDIVLVKEENLPRNQWRLGQITEALADDDNNVRKVKVTLGNRSANDRGQRVELERPINKLVLVHETE